MGNETFYGDGLMALGGISYNTATVVNHENWLPVSLNDFDVTAKFRGKTMQALQRMLMW